MLGTMRKPFFFVAVILLFLAFFADMGSALVISVTAQPAQNPVHDQPHPGMAIGYLALVDGLLLYTVALIGISLLIPERIHGRIQGLATFVISLLVLMLAIAMIIAAIAKLGFMVSLFLAVPFGTIAYFAAFAVFAKAQAAAALALIMSLKLGFSGFLFAAQQRFLQNKGLVFLILTALLTNIIVSFLHGMVPSFLASITDCIAAIVVGIIAAIWSVVFLIGSIPAIIKAI